MANFAEINDNNVVLRVIVIDNNDVIANGGDQSIGAEEFVKRLVPFTSGVRWVQTSIDGSFRKQYADIGYTFNSTKNKFIAPQPYSSWSLDSNDDWQAPVAYPTILFFDNIKYLITWDEANLRWIGVLNQNDYFYWAPESSSWIKINS
jgi:hypothetical protein